MALTYPLTHPVVSFLTSHNAQQGRDAFGFPTPGGIPEDVWHGFRLPGGPQQPPHQPGTGWQPPPGGGGQQPPPTGGGQWPNEQRGTGQPPATMHPHNNNPHALLQWLMHMRFPSRPAGQTPSADQLSFVQNMEAHNPAIQRLKTAYPDFATWLQNQWGTPTT